MKLSVGYNLQDRSRFLAACKEYSSQISEVYFSYPGMPNGRSVAPWEEDDAGEPVILSDLKRLNQYGISANLLLNANCYGGDSLRESFYVDILELVDSLQKQLQLSGVTTTSPMIAACLKERFPALPIRASINMNIRGVTAMDYLAEVFDEFYLTREFNRNLAEIRKAREYCDRHEKKLYLLANSGCLNDCPSHVFHDNLVAHEMEVNADDFRPFEATCWRYLESTANRSQIIRLSNWIRPEELHILDPYFDGAKIATRASSDAFRIVAAYARGYWHGDMLALTEPSHSGLFGPGGLDNNLFPEGYLARQLTCGKECTQCGYCQSVYRKVHRDAEEI